MSQQEKTKDSAQDLLECLLRVAKRQYPKQNASSYLIDVMGHELDGFFQGLMINSGLSASQLRSYIEWYCQFPPNQ